jgi:hypothetical protein
MIIPGKCRGRSTRSSGSPTPRRRPHGVGYEHDQARQERSLMADPAGIQDRAIQVHYEQRDAQDGQRQPAPGAAFHPRLRRRGHSGIGAHSPGQTVSSHTSQSTRTRPMVPLRTAAAPLGRAAGKAERGRLLMARSRLGRRSWPNNRVSGHRRGWLSSTYLIQHPTGQFRRSDQIVWSMVATSSGSLTARAQGRYLRCLGKGAPRSAHYGAE